MWSGEHSNTDNEEAAGAAWVKWECQAVSVAAAPTMWQGVKQWETKLQEAKGLRKQGWELGNYPKDNREPTCGFK